MASALGVLGARAANQGVRVPMAEAVFLGRPGDTCGGVHERPLSTGPPSRGNSTAGPRPAPMMAFAFDAVGGEGRSPSPFDCAHSHSPQPVEVSPVMPGRTGPTGRRPGVTDRPSRRAMAISTDPPGTAFSPAEMITCSIRSRSSPVASGSRSSMATGWINRSSRSKNRRYSAGSPRSLGHDEVRARRARGEDR